LTGFVLISPKYLLDLIVGKSLSLKKINKLGLGMINSSGEQNLKYISDVRAERLFRAAEDDFFYLKDVKEALNKLTKALEYAPCMLKAILMLANICVLEGNLDSALENYKRAEKISPDNMKILAGLANTYEMLNENEKACFYVSKALNADNSKFTPLIKSLVELKTVILMKLNRYEEAKHLIDNARYSLSVQELRELQANTSSRIEHKLKLAEKLKQHKMQLVK